MLDHDLKEALSRWTVNMHGHNLHVSRKMIQQQVRSLSNTADFKASTS